VDSYQASETQIQPVRPAANVREAVGVFTDMDALNRAVVELDTRFPRHAISVLGGKTEIERQFGQSTISPDFADRDYATPHEAPVRLEEKVVGLSVLVGSGAYIGAVAMALAAGAVSLPATIMAAVIGGGGAAAIGSILVKVLGDHYHKDIEDQIAKGGLLLWVNTPTSEDEHIATDILRRHGAAHIKVIAREFPEHEGVEL
jgi:hypothetical protein